MANAAFELKARLDRIVDALSGPVVAPFSFAIMALGVETMVCARVAQNPLGPGYLAIPVLPWLPAIPWVAVLFGAIWTACGVGLLTRRGLRISAMVLGVLLTACALVLVAPKYVASPGDMGLRTVVLEPLALAALALLMADRDAMPAWVWRASRVTIALALIVFGVDHFLALAGIGVVPSRIPWHVFWIAFFGAAFIAGGLSIGLGILERWGAASA